MENLTIAPIFQSHMVIQRDKPIVIWGTAPAQSNVTVTLCNCQNTSKTNNGTWKCTLPAQNAGTNYILSIACSDAHTNAIVLEHVSIGDVWLACGQSNMEFFLRYDAEWESIKNYEKNPEIHMFNVPQLAFKGHQRNTDGYGFWFDDKDNGFETFSAPGYSFARHIQPSLGIPIGIIGCNWGGSTASTWLDETYLQENPLSVYIEEYENAIKGHDPERLKQESMESWSFNDSPEHSSDYIPLLYGRDEEWQKLYLDNHKNDPIIPMGPFHFNRPGGLYHQMLEPLTNFSIKGVLWYQGESDALHADIYDLLFSSLICCWRKKWKDDLPFMFVQLAPFERWLDCDATNYPEVRHKQEIVSKTVNNTAMTSIMDIGCYYDIHPKQKMEVGRRLALLALGKVYERNILCENPEMETGERKAHTIIFTLRNAEGLKNIGSIREFVLKQEEADVPIDHIFIQDNKIIVEARSLSVRSCHVFFAWTNYAEVNVFNSSGLPLKPFIWKE